jgi:tRNA threonylcarbamoyl adenosine modification protein (Sua5/YciO/YrdC/YwlC family)
MAQYFEVNPRNPQRRLIDQSTRMLREGAVIAYPTDSCYALGCLATDKDALERIRQIRRLDPRHNMTLVCADLAALSIYARVDNSAFRLLKALTPGPYTFLLKATRETPRRLQHPNRKTIGLRVPDHSIAQALLHSLGEPLLSTSLILPGESLPLTDPEQIRERLGQVIDLVIAGGACGLEPTTVLDLTEGAPRLIRAGKGDIAALGL